MTNSLAFLLGGVFVALLVLLHDLIKGAGDQQQFEESLDHYESRIEWMRRRVEDWDNLTDIHRGKENE